MAGYIMLPKKPACFKLMPANASERQRGIRSRYFRIQNSSRTAATSNMIQNRFFQCPQ